MQASEHVTNARNLRGTWTYTAYCLIGMSESTRWLPTKEVPQSRVPRSTRILSLASAPDESETPIFSGLAAFARTRNGLVFLQVLEAGLVSPKPFGPKCL